VKMGCGLQYWVEVEGCQVGDRGRGGEKAREGPVEFIAIELACEMSVIWSQGFERLICAPRKKAPSALLYSAKCSPRFARSCV